jgi:[acyl-carrier-protein] S-malonyltransferase
LKTPDDLPAAWELIERHRGTVGNISATPTWRLVVAPAKGNFTMTDRYEVGAQLPPDTIVGTVANLRDSIPVVAPHGGIIVEWSVEDGDPVSPGQPLLRLHPVHEAEYHGNLEAHV